jgi:hypothetical protein
MGEEVRQLALLLDSENVRRQEEEAEILAAAKKVVQTDPDVGARSILVVAGEGCAPPAPPAMNGDGVRDRLGSDVAVTSQRTIAAAVGTVSVRMIRR